MSKNKTKITAESGKQEMFIEHEFDAPRVLVFKAMTDPQYFTQWWGPRGHKTEVDSVDVKTNGHWRYIHIDEKGSKYGFHGVYHEVIPSTRVIQTFEWEGMPETGHVTLETSTFEELPNNRTKLVIHQVLQSAADRDYIVKYGTEGINETYTRLDEFLEKLKNKK